jgi:hypothetical protein
LPGEYAVQLRVTRRNSQYKTIDDRPDLKLVATAAVALGRSFGHANAWRADGGKQFHRLVGGVWINGRQYFQVIYLAASVVY